uniref:Acyl_transf_3 domain-containing protein n=1 Tax=Elaeophora elaphi TaxID=1147741 RepID=A0A0R3RKK6_9BILA
MRLSVDLCIISIAAELVVVFGQTGDILTKRDLEQKVIWSLSPHCFRDLLEANNNYNSTFTALTALNAFYPAFGHGRSNEFITDSRFLFRMLLCFKLAGEAAFEPSQHPTTFCYRYDPKQYKSITHTICFPKACMEEQYKFWNIYEETSGMELPENHTSVSICVHSRRPLQWYERTTTVVLLCLFVLLWLLSAFSTIYHIISGPGTKTIKEQILIALSLKQNIGIIFRTPKNRSTVITCMFGIRFLTMIWIITGHPYIDNVDDFYHDIADNFGNQWITNFLLSVDVFLVLGGTVNAYGFFQRYEKMDTKPTWKSSMFWLDFYLHRIIRLWPTYCYTMVLIFFLSYLNYQELWPEVDHVEQCSKYWWQNLLLIGSLFEHRCMGWAWYISTEFIFYLLSPIFLLTLGQNQKRGYMLSIICIALSDAGRIFVMIVYNMPPTQLGWNRPPIYNSNFMEHFVMMYIKPQYRIAPYIIGLLLGHHLAKIQAKKVCNKRHSAVFIACGWILAIFLALISIYGLYPILINLNWKLYYLFYGAFHRTTFAIAIAWLIYACHNGYGSFVNAILSFKLFLPFSMLCYSVYLIHLPLIFGSFLVINFPCSYDNKSRLFKIALINLVVAYLLGFQASALVEFPILSIERSIRSYYQEKSRIAVN